MKLLRILLGCCVWFWAVNALAAPLTFDFRTGSSQQDYSLVSATDLFKPDKGFGWEEIDGIHSSKAGCSAKSRMVFKTDIGEGNFDITVTLGSEAASTTTVRAQWRRLFLDEIHTNANQTDTRTFTVNVNRAESPTTLVLEFIGNNPCISTIEIKRNTTAATIYIAGDSTVCDQEREPYAGWGQLLPFFFKPGNVAVSNHAHSGRAANSFVREKRLEKILSTIKPGDYLFVQFAHNDMKQPAMEPFTTYKAAMQVYIDEARKRKAIPVLVTSMHRRFFNDDGTVKNTLKEYPEAVRKLAAEQKVALIDLNEMSKTFYEALGPDKSKLAFVQYPANTFPGQTKDLADNTHFNEYGAFELARYVAEAIAKSDMPIAKEVIQPLPKSNTDKPALKPAAPTHKAAKSATRPEGS